MTDHMDYYPTEKSEDIRRLVEWLIDSMDSAEAATAICDMIKRSYSIGVENAKAGKHD